MGLRTAWYAAVLAAFSASATFAPVPSVASLSVLVSPRRIWLRMTPLLPRAPMRLPWLMASQVDSRFAGAPSSSATTASRVRAMLVPVSPSGTGYTLSRLIPGACALMVSRKVMTVSRSASWLKRSRVGTPTD